MQPSCWATRSAQQKVPQWISGQAAAHAAQPRRAAPGVKAVERDDLRAPALSRPTQALQRSRTEASHLLGLAGLHHAGALVHSGIVQEAQVVSEPEDEARHGPASGHAPSGLQQQDACLCTFAWLRFGVSAGPTLLLPVWLQRQDSLPCLFSVSTCRPDCSVNQPGTPGRTRSRVAPSSGVRA